MVQGGLKKVQGGLEPPLAPHFPRLCVVLSQLNVSLFFLRNNSMHASHHYSHSRPIKMTYAGPQIFLNVSHHRRVCLIDIFLALTFAASGSERFGSSTLCIIMPT